MAPGLFLKCDPVAALILVCAPDPGCPLAPGGTVSCLLLGLALGEDLGDILGLCTQPSGSRISDARPSSINEQESFPGGSNNQAVHSMGGVVPGAVPSIQGGI